MMETCEKSSRVAPESKNPRQILERRGKGSGVLESNGRGSKKEGRMSRNNETL